MKIPNKLPGGDVSAFSLHYDEDEVLWRDWMGTKDRYVVDKTASFLTLSIPTVDTVRTQHIAR